MRLTYAQLLCLSCSGLLLVTVAGCEQLESDPAVVQPQQPARVEGVWRYDSAGAAFYNSKQQFLHRFMDPMLPQTYLTIRAGRWNYSGGVREKHRYTRQGNQLVVQRLVDSATVRAGYGSWQDLGKPTGYSATLLITALTTTQLVVRDSTTDPDGSLIRVWRFYYSR